MKSNQLLLPLLAVAVCGCLPPNKPAPPSVNGSITGIHRGNLVPFSTVLTVDDEFSAKAAGADSAVGSATITGLTLKWTDPHHLELSGKVTFPPGSDEPDFASMCLTKGGTPLFCYINLSIEQKPSFELAPNSKALNPGESTTAKLTFNDARDLPLIRGVSKGLKANLVLLTPHEAQLTVVRAKEFPEVPGGFVELLNPKTGKLEIFQCPPTGYQTAVYSGVPPEAVSNQISADGLFAGVKSADYDSVRVDGAAKVAGEKIQVNDLDDATFLVGYYKGLKYVGGGLVAISSEKATGKRKSVTRP